MLIVLTPFFKLPRELMLLAVIPVSTSDHFPELDVLRCPRIPTVPGFDADERPGVRGVHHLDLFDVPGA